MRILTLPLATHAWHHDVPVRSWNLQRNVCAIDPNLSFVGPGLVPDARYEEDRPAQAGPHSFFSVGSFESSWITLGDSPKRRGGACKPLCVFFRKPYQMDKGLFLAVLPFVGIWRRQHAKRCRVDSFLQRRAALDRWNTLRMVWYMWVPQPRAILPLHPFTMDAASLGYGALWVLQGVRGFIIHLGSEDFDDISSENDGIVMMSASPWALQLTDDDQ